ncbi:glycosyltransferase [Aliishimia ponticola]|uniref:Glycosyltransferase n=2 Tax=Aliishimia ponticola TaxID=2499833 RepID=A0A4S4NFC9_9RHOB|nr:glycosyltransferase [Aliishimia ponticola]
MGAITEQQLEDGLAQQRRIDAQLGDIFLAEGIITAEQLQQALAQQHGMGLTDLTAQPPAPKMAALMGVDLCLRHNAVPWRHFGDILLVAMSHPHHCDALKSERPDDGLTVLPVLAEPEAVRAAIQALYRPELTQQAETRVEDVYSCRNWGQVQWRRHAVSVLLVAALLLWAVRSPQSLALGLAGIAIVTLAMSMALKITAAGTQLWAEIRRKPPEDAPDITPLRLPRVSVMVPLLREKEIAGALIHRLERLTYPKALLDIILVLEESDEITKQTLARTELPQWMRVIEVPSGSGLMTKPRALNYALDFCRGSIVGIWDAEDSPETDQIEQVVRHFHTAGPEVVCLQGRLDYYNSRDNWIARCFTIEYAAWWRLIMPGLARLGFVIPLGGTTLFFRRKELEELGGWDAHNVTEDADLGVRLARAGYRTELIPTVTYEEANCRAWPWIRQRSRWLKGFAITWAVHMRAPRQLWRDLGPLRFLGLQLFFVTALSQFLLAPVLWSFWLVSAGLLPWLAGAGAQPVLIGFFAGCEVMALLIHMAAVRRQQHRHLLPWTITMIAYFPMASVAIYKALYELVLRPFFWDKTEHGVSAPPCIPAKDPPAELPRPAATGS